MGRCWKRLNNSSCAAQPIDRQAIACANESHSEDETTEAPRSISGIVQHFRKGAARERRDAPEVTARHTTIYNRFNRWVESLASWQTMLEGVVDPRSRQRRASQQPTPRRTLCRRRKRGARGRRSGQPAGGRTPSPCRQPMPPAT